MNHTVASDKAAASFSAHRQSCCRCKCTFPGIVARGIVRGTSVHYKPLFKVKVYYKISELNDIISPIQTITAH